MTEGKGDELVISVGAHPQLVWEELMENTGFNDEPSQDLSFQWTGQQMREGIMAPANVDLMNGLYSSSIIHMILCAMALEQKIIGVLKKCHMLKATVQELLYPNVEDGRHQKATTRCPVMPIDMTSTDPFDLTNNCVTSGFSVLELQTFAVLIITITEEQVSAKLVIIKFQNQR